MVATSHSIRLRVDLHSKAPIIFSYPELLKRHEKTLKETPTGTMPMDDEEDPFYKALLDRAAKYDMNPGGEDVDSGEEDNQLNKDSKGDEYDYDDPFIDDSEMMLDDAYEYSQPEFDGFFVYHGALDGSDSISGNKKKSNVKKEKSSTTPAKSKASASTSSRKSAVKGEPVEISDTEEDQPNKPTSSTSSSTKTKKTPSTQKSDTTKGGPTMKKSASSTTSMSTSTDTVKKASVKSTKSGAASSSSSAATSSASKSIINGTSATNTAASSSTKAGASSSSSSTITAGDGNKKSTSKASSNKLQPLHPAIEPLMEKVRIDRAKETFEIKSKFPASLRPTVLEMATKMFRIYHKVDENVINHLMAILPYNRFTMKKFLTTKSGPGIVAEYQTEIERLIHVLKAAVDEAMPEHIQQYQQKLLEQQNIAPDGPDVEKKFRCNETIRRTLYDILTLDLYSVNLSNEIAEFGNRSDMVESETKARKAMYARLLPCWPTGWMTTYDISRQYSTYKAKVKNTEETSVKLGLSSPNASTSSASGTTMPSSGAKRSTMTPVKRSAPSTSATSYNGSSGNGNAEKRKKLSINDTPTDIDPSRPASQESSTHDIKIGMEDISIKESPSTAERNTSPSSPPSSHKPSSMNIASLISGP